MSTTQKLAALRTAMKNHHLAAYIIPSSDPHQSEYVSEHWESRAWLSGFTGSAGTLVITDSWAGFWTDSRYFLQAVTQLQGSGIKLMKMNEDVRYGEWLADTLPAYSRIGMDGRLFSVKQEQNLCKHLIEKELQLIECDLIKEIWQNRPSLSQAKITLYDIHYAGKSSQQKIAEIRAEMQIYQADAYLLSMLDEIAWLFNLRGKDVPFNPVFYAYASITEEEAHLFIDFHKIDQTIVRHLEEQGITIGQYDDFEYYLNNISVQQNILLDANTFPSHLYQKVKSNKIEKSSLLQSLKAIKNDKEIEHLRKTMEKDGVALLRTYHWLEKTLQERSVSEVELGEQLHFFRKQQTHYQGDSFDSIVGFRANGAIVHYRAMPETCANIEGKGILLVDSGGQYLDGTTDITRTITISKPTAEQKRNFTLVLKGHIALATIKFPQGTTGTQLDILARQFLWQHHLNYGHGTGHGVGFHLNVHESPPSISPSTNRATVLKAGMVFSNEPGFYKTGEYGIRIENLLLCVEDIETEDFGQFLRFETLSLFPIDYALIDTSLMTSKEMAWLNRYHHWVYEKLTPYLEEEERKWLELKCRKL